MPPWFEVARAVVELVIAAGIIVFTLGRKWGWFEREAGVTDEMKMRIDNHGTRLTHLEQWRVAAASDIEGQRKRLDAGGHKISDLASTVNGIEQRFREIFLSKEVADQLFRESRDDRARLRADIDKLRNGR